MALPVDRWVGRHTSMRGRLAFLLIACLVLPLLAVGVWDYRDAAQVERLAKTLGSDSPRVVEANSRASTSARLLRDLLDGTVASFALEVAQLKSAEQADIDAVFSGHAFGGRPSLVAEIASLDQARDELPAELVEAIAAAKAGRPREELVRGYVVMPDPEDGGARHVYEVVLVPRGRSLSRGDGAAAGDAAAGADPGRDIKEERTPPKGPFLVAARDVAKLGDGEQVLDSLAADGVVSRALVLPDGTIALRRTGAGRHGKAGEDEDLIAELAEGQAAWSVARDECTRGEIGLFPVSGRYGAAASVPLLGLGGQPVALLAVEAEAEPGLMPGVANVPLPSDALRGTLLHLSLLGFALAIGLGLLAPRFIWRDIRRSTDFIFHSAERLRELVRRISLALDEQGRVIRDLSATVASLEGASTSIADTSRSLARSAEQSAWVSQSGNLKAEMAQRAVVDMRESVNAIREQMGELDRRCAEIGDKLQSIADLSSETNKVSINASIQLRVAGSDGQHFGEFVEEIRSLADQALDCTRDIRQVVGEIQESSRTTVGATDLGVKEVDRCQAAFEELETSFARILRWVEDTTQSAQGIQRSTHAQSDSLQSVARAIGSLEERARETAGHFDAVVDATEELAGLGEQMKETWRVG